MTEPEQTEDGRLAPTHYCAGCAARWIKHSDGSWSLLSHQAGRCCDNADMSVAPIIEIQPDGTINGDDHDKAKVAYFCRVLGRESAKRMFGSRWLPPIPPKPWTVELAERVRECRDSSEAALTIQRAFEERERKLREALKAVEDEGLRNHNTRCRPWWNQVRQALKETPDAQ